MKILMKSLARRFYFKSCRGRILFLVIFISTGFSLDAQDLETAKGYLASAQSAAAQKVYWNAAQQYTLAAKEYEGLSGQTKLDFKQYEYLNTAMECHKKAAINFSSTKKFTEEQNATKEAERIEKLITQKGLDHFRKEKKKDETPQTDIVSQIPYKPGTEVYFNCKTFKLAYTPPLGWENIGPRPIKIQETTPPTTLKQYNFSLVSLDLKIRMSITEFPNGYDVSKHTSAVQYCDELSKTYQEKMQKFPQSKKEEQMIVNLNTCKACLEIKESNRQDVGKVAMFQMIFYYKTTGFLLSVNAPYNWKDAITQSLNGIKILDLASVTNSCNNGEFKDLRDKAIKNTFEILNPDKQVRIIIEPVLSRSPIPSAWHDLIELTRKGVGKIEGVFPQEEITNGEVKRIIFVLEKLGIEELTPGKAADAYLDIFDKMIYGVEGLEKKISGMVMNLRIEIPVKQINTQCIPGIVCKNGQWYPDLMNMKYEKLGEDTFTYVYKNEFLTPSQLAAAQEKYLDEFLQKLQRRGKEYSMAASCDESKQRLSEIDFGVMPDECAQRENSVVSMKWEIEEWMKDSVQYATRLQILKKENPDKLNSVNTALSNLEKHLAKKQKSLKDQQNVLSSMKQTRESTKGDKTELDLQVTNQEQVVKDLQVEISALLVERQELYTEKNRLTTKAYENEVESLLNEAIAGLKLRRESLAKRQALLSECNKKK